MQLTVQGKQINVGESLRGHVEDTINDLNDKYFGRATDSTVTFSKEGNTFYKVQISIHISKNITAQAHAMEKDPYVTFDSAAAKLAKQLRRYKRKLRDHHEREEATDKASSKAHDYVIEDKVSEDNAEPAIIAEMVTNIQTMSVSEAVMRMDLSGHSAILFRNDNNDGINMVYRRNDGNIGWVDTETNIKASK